MLTMEAGEFVRSIDNGERITIFGDGRSARDYTFIDDIIGGVIRSIERVDGYGIYNLGNSTPTVLSDLVETIGFPRDAVAEGGTRPET